MKPKKKFFSLLLTLCLVFSFSSTTAFAAYTTDYGISVDGVLIRSSNKDDVLRDKDGDAKSVTFDPATATLTLDNADFVTDKQSDEGAIIWSDKSPFKNLTICVKGSNQFTRVLATSDEQRTLTFTGSGSVTLTGAYAQMHTNLPENLDLVFDGITFNIDARPGCYGIAGNDVTITNGAKVTASTEDEVDAILALHQLKIIDNSTVNATATDGSAIAANNDDGNEAIVIQNSSVTAKGKYNGIYSNGSLTIQQSEVTAEGEYPALFGENNMAIADSSIIASSTTDYGIWAGVNLSMTGDTKVISDGGANAGNSFTITPKAGSFWNVFVGNYAEDAALMDGSPFEGNDIVMSGMENYYYFECKPHEHNYGDWQVTKKATCSAAGEKERICSTCNRKETAEVAIDSAAHAFTNYVYNNDAKIGVDGTETATCDNGCGEKDTRTKKGTALSGGGGGGGYIPTLPTAPTTQKPEVLTGDGYTATLGTDGTTVNITLQEGYELVDVTVNGVSKGKVTVITGLKTGDKIEVKVAKKMELSAADKVKEELAAVTADNFTARSKQVKLKNGKMAVKITWNNTSGVKFDGVEIFRSVKRYSGYGKKAIFTTENNTYYNTAVKEGTKYYYKVRGYVEVDGVKYYSTWSKKAWRTVK